MNKIKIQKNELTTSKLFCIKILLKEKLSFNDRSKRIMWENNEVIHIFLQLAFNTNYREKLPKVSY